MLYEITTCLHHCVKAYNDCELMIERYKTFDELTARLGDGFPATVAYDDWRKQGVPGIRPLMLNFFYTAHCMAEQRLILLELIQYQGRNWMKKLNIDENRMRWRLIWNGNDIIVKTILW